MKPTTLSWLSILLDASIKGALLLVLAGLTSLALRRSSAAVRYMVWCMAVLGVFLLPALGWFLPSWRLPILPRETPAIQFVSHSIVEPTQPLVVAPEIVPPDRKSVV